MIDAGREAPLAGDAEAARRARDLGGGHEGGADLRPRIALIDLVLAFGRKHAEDPMMLDQKIEAPAAGAAMPADFGDDIGDRHPAVDAVAAAILRNDEADQIGLRHRLYVLRRQVAQLLRGNGIGLADLADFLGAGYGFGVRDRRHGCSIVVM
jgi:hypothetical protein